MHVSVTVNTAALIALREKDGQSQVGLASAAGITRQQLCDIEKGRRNASPAVRKKLALALRVPTSAIESLTVAVGAGGEDAA